MYVTVSLNPDESVGPVERRLTDRYLQAFLQTAFGLEEGPDQEITLQALIRAAARLKERFEGELEELRQESD